MTQDLITISEAARLKNVTRSVIYKAIGRGDLRVEIVLGHQAVHRDEVQTWEPRKAGRRKGTPVSEEAKAKISRTQKTRWQKRRHDET